MRRFRRFAAACAAARSRLTQLADRYFNHPDVQRVRQQLEALARESEAILTRTIHRLRSTGAGQPELLLVTDRRAGLAAFVREVRHKFNGLSGAGGWTRLFAERAHPCGASLPRE